MALLAGLRARLAEGKTAPPRQPPPRDRVGFAQLLWGEGFVWPGGPEHILDLAAPLHLGRGSLVLDLAAGLGGPARALARGRGAWVTGLERSVELAPRGMALSEAAGLARKAPVLLAPVDGLELEAAAFDAVFARFATYDVVEKERLLRVAIGALKPGGRLLLVDFVRRGAEAPGWAGFDSSAEELWSVEQYADCLAGLGAVPGFTADLAEPYRALMRAGWRRLPQILPGLAGGDLALVGEHAASWSAQADALDARTLGVACFFVEAG